jgi:hypothetical protein
MFEPGTSEIQQSGPRLQLDLTGTPLPERRKDQGNEQGEPDQQNTRHARPSNPARKRITQRQHQGT